MTREDRRLITGLSQLRKKFKQAERSEVDPLEDYEFGELEWLIGRAEDRLKELLS